MSKGKKSIRFRLPPYTSPRGAWRRLVHAAAKKAMREGGVEYTPDDKLEVLVKLYLTEVELRMHDVDNRLKDIMDALQGRVAGSGKQKPALTPLIENDTQVWRALIEKSEPPQQSHGMGQVIVRRYKPYWKFVLKKPAAN